MENASEIPPKCRERTVCRDAKEESGKLDLFGFPLLEA